MYEKREIQNKQKMMEETINQSNGINQYIVIGLTFLGEACVGGIEGIREKQFLPHHI